VTRWRFCPRSICLRIVLAQSRAADWERWLWWQRKSTSRPSGVVACPLACQLGWLLPLLRVDVESHTGPTRTPIRTIGSPLRAVVAWNPFADLLDAFVGTGVYERRTSQFDFVQGRTGRIMLAVRTYQTSDRFVVDAAHNESTSLRGDAGYD
jgi:hypothetical protein